MIFFIGNIITGVSVNFSMLLFFRFLTGLCHGAMFSVGAVVAASLVPKNKQGSAVAICFTALFIAGFTLLPLFSYTSSLGLPSVGASLYPAKFLATYRALPMARQY
ncbi:MFS transporter [bacterium]|nr:MFS transporter [bacterium]